MKIVLFDVGGTLVTDPFRDVLERLRAEGPALLGVPFGGDDWSTFLEFWSEENARSDHPFASHFLQEEVWPARALLRMWRDRRTPRAEEIPLGAPLVLHRYRELARLQIAGQPQLASIRRALEWLKECGVRIAAASNDRELATRPMLTWAGLADSMEAIFTSEGLSAKHIGAEKPSVEFFRAALHALGGVAAASVVYVGDSERNDIVPARALGLKTVRFTDHNAPAGTNWLDTTANTVADAVYDDPAALVESLQAVLQAP